MGLSGISYNTSHTTLEFLDTKIVPVIVCTPPFNPCRGISPAAQSAFVTVQWLVVFPESFLNVWCFTVPVSECHGVSLQGVGQEHACFAFPNTPVTEMWVTHMNCWVSGGGSGGVKRCTSGKCVLCCPAQTTWEGWAHTLCE